MIDESAQRNLAIYLSEYAANVIQEWMRIVDVNESVLSCSAEAFQARARWQRDGSLILAESPYGGEDYGHYRVTVKVEPLDVPPIGPENDPAMIEELKEWVLSEWRYVTNDDVVRLPGRPETEARVFFVTTGGWHAKVTQYTAADGGVRDWVEPYDHDEISVFLQGRAGALHFAPLDAVEILMDAHRRATLTVQQAFPGTTKLESDPS